MKSNVFLKSKFIVKEALGDINASQKESLDKCVPHTTVDRSKNSCVIRKLSSDI